MKTTVAIIGTTKGPSEYDILRSLPNPDLTPGEVCVEPPAIQIEKRFPTLFEGQSQNEPRPHRSIRPAVPYAEPRLVPTSVRKLAFARYGVLYCERRSYDLDHLVPLSLGGTNGLLNLWPHALGAPFNPRHKLRLEARLRRLVASGQMPLREAQEMLMENWVQAYRRFFV